MDKEPLPEPPVKRRGTVKLHQSRGPPQGFYHPDISVLTIGDGDLSFSRAVSDWVKYKFGTDMKTMVASTYDTEAALEELYGPVVKGNIQKLKDNAVRVLHGVDVNELDKEEARGRIDPTGHKFDRLVWNFPHAGFPDKSYGPGFEWEEGFHEKHITIISKFFEYSKLYLKQGGLILMAHKTVEPFSIWDIQGIAKANNYALVSKEPFHIQDYPGYENRRGAGKNGGKRFPIDDAVQYVFA